MAKLPSKQEVYATSAFYSKAFFGGVLRPAIHWCRMRNYGDCFEPEGKYPYGLIRLSTMLPRRVSWHGVLLHEHIHCYLDILYPHVDEWEHGTVPYHGKVFQAECNRIGAALGLPEVSLEECWGWPHAMNYSYFEPARAE